MVEVVSQRGDDIAFIEGVRRCLASMIDAELPKHVCLVRLDNWFDGRDSDP